MLGCEVLVLSYLPMQSAGHNTAYCYLIPIGNTVVSWTLLRSAHCYQLVTYWTVVLLLMADALCDQNWSQPPVALTDKQRAPLPIGDAMQSDFDTAHESDAVPIGYSSRITDCRYMRHVTIWSRVHILLFW